MLQEPVSADFFAANRAVLATHLPAGHIAVLHANDLLTTNADGTVPYVPNTDLYYLTGIRQEETILILYPDAPDGKQREILYVRETSDLLRVWEGDKLTHEQARERSGVETVKWTASFDEDFQRLARQADGIALNINEHLRAGDESQSKNARFARECRERFPLHPFSRLAPLLARQRIIKHDIEVDMIREAIGVTDAALRRVLAMLKPGVGEWEILAGMTHEVMCNKSRGFGFETIVASGPDTCVLHYVSNDKACADGGLVLIDCGAEWNGWNADITRTYPVNGKFTARQRAVYDAVLRVNRYAQSILRPGTPIKDYQRRILNEMQKELIGLGLIDAADAAGQDDEKPLVKKYFMHGTSHHLGLDVHDVSPPNASVEAGMVLTVEPGIYIPDEGIGIRLEDDILIGESQNLNLSADIPIEPDDIEKLMARG